MKKNTVLQIIIALVLIGVLAAGGFTLYRLGYMQGAHAALPYENDGRLGSGFQPGSGPDSFSRSGPDTFMRSRPDFFFRSERVGVSLLRVVPGLLILLGLIGVVILGTVLLSRRFLFQQPVPSGQTLPPVEPQAAEEQKQENAE